MWIEKSRCSLYSCCTTVVTSETWNGIVYSNFLLRLKEHSIMQLKAITVVGCLIYHPFSQLYPIPSVSTSLTLIRDGALYVPHVNAIFYYDDALLTKPLIFRFLPVYRNLFDVCDFIRIFSMSVKFPPLPYWKRTLSWKIFTLTLYD